jgi:predicted enzyme related to lactoylglutathione lyase
MEEGAKIGARAMSSLIGQLPLAAVWFYCKDVSQSERFYKDVVGLKPIEDESGESGPHFDLGTIRLTLLPSADGAGQKNNGGEKPASQHLMFLVESSIEAVYRDLVKRGVKMKSKKIAEDGTGKTIWFTDPDGHVIYLWQPPRKDSKNFKQVETLVKHYESVSRALADLRQYDEEANGEN